MWADADSSCTESCTDSWRHWLGSLCGQAARRTSRSSSCATNSACCAARSTDPRSPTPTGARSERSRPRYRDRAEPGGWSPPTRCWVGTAAASPGTGLNHSDRRADHRPQRSLPTRTAPRSRESNLAIPPRPRRTRRARPPPRCVHGLGRSSTTPESTPPPHAPKSPGRSSSVPGRRRLRLRHHRNRHAAQVLPAVLHRHPHPNRVLRRDH